MWKIVVFSTLVAGFFFVHQAQTCNEAVCGSIVSKCLLTQSCKCDFSFENCTCCKDCFNCLSYLYAECCSCVDMCPKPNDTEGALNKKSNVEDFMEPVPALFNTLTEFPDNELRWNSTTFPIDIDTSQYGPKKEIKIHMQSAEQEVAPIKTNVITLNCTVAFMSKCMSLTKCRAGCQTMGASSYRWFHDGCCECIGQHCINYGINESRCRECPLKDEIEEADYDYDYGQNSEEFD
ncbi:protein twisted gastrulation-like [Tribolium madens]|uniref:protein twisted gastrulation-like n=1 Tax=Tribolium madens TaxID=41895 RepID=UPI001CF722BB|nr:protein twisted gastrulation-like [Tribolium madens]